MFALVDCNTFYASCEQIFNPAVRNKPVVVLSNNDGCIISLNREAKALDIPNIVPFYQVRKMLEAHKVHIFSSNYELYGDISRRVMRLLEPYATEMEVYSIDEAFLRLHCQDFQAHGQEIKDILWQQVRMPVCVGIAPTKTLAKLANHAAKKISKLNGVCVLDSQKKIDWLLRRTPTEEIWGIGKRLSNSLKIMGINTALELTLADIKLIKRRFSVVLEKTVRELKGEVCLDLELERTPRKEIISSRSFSYKITEVHELQQAISLYTARACEKMRLQNGLTARIWVYAESSRKYKNPYYQQRFVRLPHLTNDTRVVSKYAAEAIAQIYRADVPFKKCGIGLLDICTRKYEQIDFFALQQSAHSRQLMSHMDKVNQRYGKNTLQLANMGLNPQWTMHRNYKSPAYTTRWQDIPVVRC